MVLTAEKRRSEADSSAFGPQLSMSKSSAVKSCTKAEPLFGNIVSKSFRLDTFNVEGDDRNVFCGRVPIDDCTGNRAQLPDET